MPTKCASVATVPKTLGGELWPEPPVLCVSVNPRQHAGGSHPHPSKRAPDVAGVAHICSASAHKRGKNMKGAEEPSQQPEAAIAQRIRSWSEAVLRSGFALPAMLTRKRTRSLIDAIASTNGSPTTVSTDDGTTSTSTDSIQPVADAGASTSADQAQLHPAPCLMQVPHSQGSFFDHLGHDVVRVLP